MVREECMHKVKEGGYDSVFVEDVICIVYKSVGVVSGRLRAGQMMGLRIDLEV